MSGFINRSACRGRRPAAYSAFKGFQRPTLVSLMLRERNVARFIVAPGGYGKTSLALEYAETMFAWSGVIWINAQSPCFIRDLDAGVIVSACLGLKGETELVVFDDVPLLDPTRAQRFSEAIDGLLEAGSEVVVTCRPSCDVAGQLQSDRLGIGAHDLLLSDGEVDEARPAEERVRRPAGEIPPTERVAALAWQGDEDARNAFAAAALGEDVPGDSLLAMGSILVLQDGSFADLAGLGVTDERLLADLGRAYPHLGIERDAAAFHAVRLDIASIAGALKARIDAVLPHSAFETCEDIVQTWADILLRNGLAARACGLMGAACPRPLRAPWVCAHALKLVRAACIYPTFELAREQRGLSGELKQRMLALEALCRRLLGDEEGALRSAKRCAFNEAAPLGARTCAALVVAHLSTGEVLLQALKMLESISARGAGASAKAPGAAGTRQPARQAAAAEGGLDWPLLARAWCAGVRGAYALSELWLDCRDAGASDDVLGLCASWAFGLTCRSRRDDPQGEMSPQVQRQLEEYVYARLAHAGEGADDFFAVSAGLSMEEAHGRGMRFAGKAPSASVLFSLRRAEMSMMAQRGQFENAARAERARYDERVATRPDSYLTASAGAPGTAQARNIPVLSLRFFGRFEVAIGGQPLEVERFKRNNVKVLLVLLAVNQGKEVSREQLSAALWPDSEPDLARKNFYTVWSQLRKTLALPDGSCPYLVRHQFGCSIEQRYVQSDIDRFSEICRELLFGVPDLERWSGLFVEVDRDYSSDLMPAEKKNQMVIQARREYQARLVDALVAAALGIVEAGHPRWGIWFAREAVKHDQTREDAYVALMRAQIAGIQRTAAMMTFLQCRRVLNDQLGIDPSPETVALYESLLDG